MQTVTPIRGGQRFTYRGRDCIKYCTSCSASRAPDLGSMSVRNGAQFVITRDVSGYFLGAQGPDQFLSILCYNCVLIIQLINWDQVTVLNI
jgi:hypothetical protein